MSKLSDKKKQASVNQKTTQEVAEHAKKKSEIKKTDPAVKATAKKDNVELASAKSSAADTQKKSSAKLTKHIADEIKILPSKRVWPD